MTFKHHSTIKHLSTLLALLLLAGAVAGCNGAGNTAETNTESVTQTETEAETATKTDTEIETETQAPTVIYVPVSEAVTFVTDEEKAAWREPLVAFLTNLQAEDTSPISVMRGREVSLVDITRDGVPEVLINKGGGTMMNSYVEVFDLYTGAELGDITIGLNPVKLYYHTPSGEYKYVTRFELRGGWDDLSHYTTEITYDPTEKAIACETLLFAEFFRDNVHSDEWRSYTYHVNGETATFADYTSAMRAFADEYVLIPDAEVQEVRWTDLDGFQTEPSVPTDAQWAERMADALLNTAQKFIKFE